MDLTRRGVVAVACAAALVVGAALLAEPMLLVAAAGVAAWLLGSQIAFATALQRERASLRVSISGPDTAPGVGDAARLRAHATARGALPLQVVIETPAAATPIDGGEDRLTIDLGTASDTERSAGGSVEDEASCTVTWEIAGRYQVGPTRLQAADRQGLFNATLETDAAIDVVVRSREPETRHLGQGGDRIAAFGEHSSGRHGPGTEPAELRPYHPGDDLGRIDWNATARLREAYVTESEAETDRRTVLFVDHRATTGEGPPGGTPLDYLRYAGLAIVESARDLGDPLGYYAVGDEGITDESAPRTSPEQYETVADALRTLRPTGRPTSNRSMRPGNGATGVSPTGGPESSPNESAGTAGVAVARGNQNTSIGRGATTTGTTSGDPARAAEYASRLSADDSQFAERLTPLLGDATPYLHRVADEPLFAAVRTYLDRLQGNVWSVILSDGERPGELRETVKLARRGNDRVLVVLAPSPLFESGLGDLDERRQTYEDVADFAQSLAAMERVTVREIAPGDVAEAVLGTGGGRA